MKRILIVDDHEENRYLLRVMMEGKGYEVEQARNGSEAIVKALMAPPDMVISDILMPSIDGYTLCRIWKADERLKGVPFVFYTATYTDPRDERLALDMGADAFIIKPAEPDEFVRRIESVFAPNREHLLASPRNPRFGDETILKQYNEVLVRKLEHKMLELERVNRELKDEMAAKSRIEATLRESEELFRNLFHQHSAVKLIIDPDTGKIIDANEAAVSFYGWPAERLLTMNIQDINILDVGEVKAAMEMARKHERIRFEFRHQKADGSVRDVEVFSSRIRVRGKDLLHSIIHDITDRKQAEEELRENERLFRLITENMTDTIWLLDLNFKYTYASASLLKNRGYTIEELNSIPMDRIMTPESYARAMAMIREEVTPERLARKDLDISRTIELENYRKDGSTFWSEVTMTLLRDPVGAPIGFLGVGRDITERKIAEAKIVQLNAGLEQMVSDRTAELQRANQELESFSYSISHDLRAPLRALDGYSQILLDDYSDRLDDQGRGYLQRLRASSQRLSQLIDDILRLSLIGQAQLVAENMDLSAMAEEVARRLAEQDPDRTVRFNIVKGLEAIGDKALLLVALDNLIGNAWKFTSKRPDAFIEFGAANADGGRFFFVRDNGAGFDMRYADRLFTPFQRLHPADEFDGTGVGLAIVRRIINRHGGRIWAEGETGRGSSFYFTIGNIQSGGTA
jgi:PAS domain S-box-containing protein